MKILLSILALLAALAVSAVMAKPVALLFGMTSAADAMAMVKVIFLPLAFGLLYRIWKKRP